MTDTTLQINLSPGDADYAELTVPALLEAHPDAAERLLVIDGCKPQATGIVDPARRFPEPAFSQRLERVRTLADHWLSEGRVGRIVVLRPGDPIFRVLSRKYLRPWVRETHDYGGCALMSYLAAFELCRTRWLLHYDADMLLHQEGRFDWVGQAQGAMVDHPFVVAATPRPSPPTLEGPDAPTNAERLPLYPHPAGWLNIWFSTRCYLFDLERFRPCLPLMQGRTYWEVLAARILRRGYPRSPEGLLCLRMAAAGRTRLALRDRRAWLLHPLQKDAAFVSALPRLLAAIHEGRCPDGQRGDTNLDLRLWEQILAQPDQLTKP
jgi:hypothetical protein